MNKLKQNLFVVFHASADVDQERQAALLKATYASQPRAAFFYNPSSPGLYEIKIGNHFINASDKDAFETIRHAAKDNRIAMVTLCPQMMQSALENDVAVVTLSFASMSAGRYRAITSPAYVDSALRSIAYP